MFVGAKSEEGSYEGLFRAVFETAVDGIVIADTQGAIIAVNPAMQSIFGYAPEELIGYNVRMLMPPPYQEEHDSYIRNYLSTGVRKIIGIGRDVHGRRKDGTVFPMTLGISETSTASGRVFVGIIRDISERVSAMELRVAKLAAEQANEAKNDFLSRMSHELRTPLNAVLGFAQLLAMQYEEARIQQATESIRRAGQHLLNLINEVLDLSRIESGHMSMSMEPVRLDELVRQAISLLKPQADRMLLSITVEVSPDSFVKADRQRLLQVLINVLSNAIKYNRERGSIDVWTENSGPTEVRLLVKDTGIGIAEADRDRLYQPFERLSSSAVEGTGLGLVLCRKFMKLMGGGIELVSSDSNGSTFAVVANRVEAVDLSQTPTSLEVALRVDAPSGRILYIEDNLPNLKLVEMSLERWGSFELMPAMQGQVGIDLADHHVPDLILLDLHLPDMPGEEVLRRLRLNERTASIPVIVVSADATPGQMQRLKSLGAVDYLTKPLDLFRFLKVVGEHLKEK